jgi:hypothetical protein
MRCIANLVRQALLIKQLFPFLTHPCALSALNGTFAAVIHVGLGLA